jgi:hypothetical protein
MSAPRFFLLIWDSICKNERTVYGVVWKFTEVHNINQHSKIKITFICSHIYILGCCKV